jgi:hypothetical protein
MRPYALADKTQGRTGRSRASGSMDHFVWRVTASGACRLYIPAKNKSLRRVPVCRNRRCNNSQFTVKLSDPGSPQSALRCFKASGKKKDHGLSSLLVALRACKTLGALVHFWRWNFSGADYWLAR